MEIRPAALKRGDTLDEIEGSIIGTIGAFSEACINNETLKEPMEVVLLEGSNEKGFKASLGSAVHKLYEGPLTQAKISFTLEAFKTDTRGNILAELKKDSRTFMFDVKKDLQNFILESSDKNKIDGALLYVKGIAEELHVFGHNNPNRLNDETKIFDHVKGSSMIEGWGSLSFVDGTLPFVHIHGVYEQNGIRKGGHFIMDDRTHLMLEQSECIIYPVGSLIRKAGKEDFPTWSV